MAQVWYPGAVKNPGVAANYQLGRTTMVDCVCHETIGTDSTAIGLRGYFNWLVSRDGRVQQFAEADALTYHVGEDNAYGPGIEVEYLPGQDDAVFTPQARTACAALIKWLSSEWGIPLVYHDGDHDIQPGTYAGFLSHKSIIQTEEHQDYWPQADWDLMVGTLPTPTDNLLEDPMVTTQLLPDGTVLAFCVGTDNGVYCCSRDKTGKWGGWSAVGNPPAIVRK